MEKLRGIEELLERSGLGGCRILVPRGPGASPFLWVLQAGSIPAPGGVAPGDILVLDGSRLPADAAESRELAARWKREGCSVCACARFSPPASFIQACEAEGLPLLELPADTGSSQAALRLALFLAGAGSKSAAPEERRSAADREPEPPPKAPRAPSRGEGPAALSRVPDRAGLLRILAAAGPPGGRRPSARRLGASLAAALPGGAGLTALGRSEAGMFFFLLSTRRGDDRESREGLRALASEEKLSLGLSAPVPSGGPLEPAREEALQALRLGQALMGPGHLASYDNAALYLAYIDDGKSEPLLAFSRRTVEKIRDHDERTGDGLMATLEAYFRNDRNARRTASELGIQRHTLANRLARIESLTDYPLKGEGRIGYELALTLRYWTKARISR